jgi:hypothetical protein
MLIRSIGGGGGGRSCPPAETGVEVMSTQVVITPNSALKRSIGSPSQLAVLRSLRPLAFQSRQPQTLILRRYLRLSLIDLETLTIAETY